MKGKNNMDKQLIKYFAGKGIRVRFEKNAVPSASATTIILPSNILEDRIHKLMTAVLHECEHIRSTDYDIEINPYVFQIVNAVEDSRINRIIYTRYPNAKTLFKRTMKELLPDRQKSENEAIKSGKATREMVENLHILFNICWRAEEMDVQFDDGIDWINRNSDWVDGIVKRIKKAFNTYESMEIALEIITKLFNKDPDSDFRRELRNLKRKINLMKRNKKRLQKLENEKGKLSDEYKIKSEQRKRLSKEIERLKDEKMKIDRGEYEKLRNELRKLNELSCKLDEETAKLSQKGRSVAAAENRLRKNNDELSGKIERMLEELCEAIFVSSNERVEFSKLAGNMDIGFNNIGESDYDPNYTEIDADTKAIFKKFLEEEVNRIHKTVNTGVKLNMKKIAEYKTYPDEIMYEDISENKISSRIVFIVDGSGSMSGKRTDTVKDALKSLTSAIDEVKSG
ncbi:MAG: hypothetical protein ACTSPI_17180, partial [Candidatus Heimdallarchaeaceae archaeon]